MMNQTEVAAAHQVVQDVLTHAKPHVEIPAVQIWLMHRPLVNPDAKAPALVVAKRVVTENVNMEVNKLVGCADGIIRIRTAN